MNKDIPISLSFDDVLIKPKYSDVSTRKSVLLRTELVNGSFCLDHPIVASMMPSVCENEMAVAMGDTGGLGIIHRMQSIASQSNQVKLARDDFEERLFPVINIGAAIGIGDDFLERASACIRSGANILCVDVAHGAQGNAVRVLNRLLDSFEVPIIFGNIASGEEAVEVINRINYSYKHKLCLKVGIGGGSVCRTRVVTGVGVPTLQSVYDVSSALFNEGHGEVKLMADGGIRNGGDIVKCLVAGASTVMVGSLLSGTTESPGDVIKDDRDDRKYKIYRGCASYGVKRVSFEDVEYIEGSESLVPYKGSVEKVIRRLCEGVSSACSYVGASNIYGLKLNSEFIRITNAGYRESIPHGLL